MDDLLQEFIAETRETLEAIAGEIVAWEADPADRARLDSIFRFVHTVKGSCGFLDLPRLARLSHAAEDVLAAVRSGDRVPDRHLVNAVLAIIDRIGELVEAIDAGVALDDSSEDFLLAALDGASAAPEPTRAEPVAVVSRAQTRSVRLSVDLLDRMMSGVSDMVLARNELARRVRDVGHGDTGLEATLDRLTLTVAELRETVSRTRMQTIEALFSPLPRVVRDTATSLGKQVTLAIQGGDVELDREMIEMLRDPLVHMVRNALDHGIEMPAERRAAGKRESGRLCVGARQSGNRIIVEISDDGRGIDVDRLVNKAVAADPSRAPAIAAMGAKARLDLIFEAGLSSRDEVTALSGRGVGMDVVRSNVEQIGGTLSLANDPGRGLTVAIEVPLTLAILSTVIVEAGGEKFALPRQVIDEIVAIDADVVRIDRVGDATLARVRNRRLPLVSLAAIIGATEDDRAAMLLIVDVPGGAYALAVDAVTDTEELVVKPAAPPVMVSGLYAGQTLPDSGLPLLLLDCAGVGVRAGLTFARTDALGDVADVPPPAPERPRILLFDDIDGRRRAIALAAVDRIETAPTDAIHRAGGRWWATVDGGMVPLRFAAEPAVIPSPAWLMRLHDDRGELAYLIAEALDIVALPDEIAAPATDGAIAGVVLIEDEPVELLDPLWLLSDGAAPGATAPLCLLAGADAGWMDMMLRPLVIAAGYRVTTTLAAGEEARVTLLMDDDEAGSEARGAIIRLSRDGRAGIARHDRAALRAALAAGIAG